MKRVAQITVNPLELTTISCGVCMRVLGPVEQLDSTREDELEIVYPENYNVLTENPELFEMYSVVVGEKLEDLFNVGFCHSCATDLRATHAFLRKCKESREVFKKMPNKDLCPVVVEFEEEEEYLDEWDLGDEEPSKSPEPPDKSSPGRKPSKAKLECKSCPGFRASSFSKLRSHLWSHPKDAPQVCPFCESEFDFTLNCIAHLSVCPRNPHKRQDCDWKCPICDKLVSHLHNHIGTEHAELRAYECDLCQRSFSSRANCYNHMVMSHVSKGSSHVCDLCGESYATNLLMRSHRKKVHLFEPKKCPHCDFSTRLTYNLNVHMRKHEDRRDFECIVCGKKFLKKQLLKNHIETHTTEKNFECEICGKYYKTDKSLRNHRQKLHKGEQSDCVGGCGRSFGTQTMMWRHVRKSHPEAAEKEALL